MVSGICAVIFTLLQLASAVIALKIRGEIAEIKVHIAESRAKDREELRDWVEEHFLRRDAGVGYPRWQPGTH